MTQQAEHIVVIGAGIAGLLTAAAAAAKGKHVTVFERDDTNPREDPRPTVPQGWHSHLLQVRGQRLLEQMIPGLFARLVDAGAVRISLTQDVALLHRAGWRPRYPSELEALSMTRSLLERTIATHVSSLPGVTILRGHRVSNVGFDARGVLVQSTPTSGTRAEVRGELLVDTSGRHGALGRLLAEKGLTLGQEERMVPHVKYASAFFRPRTNRTQDWKVLLVAVAVPREREGAVIYPVEGGRWLVTCIGIGGVKPPSKATDFLAFARTLRVPDIADALAEAEAITPAHSFQATENWRIQPEGTKWPGKVILLGDCAIRMNPMHGQGITAGAVAVASFGRWLERGSLSNFSASDCAQFQRDLGKELNGFWLAATGEDVRWPTTEGRSITVAEQVMAQVGDRYLRASTRDPNLDESIVRLSHGLAGTSAFLTPAAIWSMLRNGRAAS